MELKNDQKKVSEKINKAAEARALRRRKRQQKIAEKRRAQAMYLLGKSTLEIADTLDRKKETVKRWLEELKERKQDISEWKAVQADALAYLQKQSYQVRMEILDSLQRDGGKTIAMMTENEKRSWYHTLAVAAGIDHDHERLERGQSTANIAVYEKFIATLQTEPTDSNTEQK